MTQSERVTTSPISPAGSSLSSGPNTAISTPVRAVPQVSRLRFSLWKSWDSPVMVIGLSPWPYRL